MGFKKAQEKSSVLTSPVTSSFQTFRVVSFYTTMIQHPSNPAHHEPASKPQPKQPNCSSPRYQCDLVTSLVKTFLDDIEFVPTGINPTNKALEDYLYNFLHTRGIEYKQLKRSVHISCSLIEVGYNQCTLDEKKNLALFNWLALYTDDLVSNDPIPLQDFGSRLFRREPQLDPVLNLFPEVLGRMWDLYDPLIANSIFSTVVAFITGNCIESSLKTSDLVLVPGVEGFTEYIRNITGLSVSYSAFPFTKEGNFDMLNIAQALPNMNYWTNLSNDLLSFHKEESAGEDGTYVHNRARDENKSPYEMLTIIMVELRKIRQNIHAALGSNPAALERWKTFEHGYVEWHLYSERYRLHELCLKY